jgi:hypothetical protein
VQLPSHTDLASRQRRSAGGLNMAIPSSVRRAARAIAALAGVLGLFAAQCADAFEFRDSTGTFTGSWDTTLSFGAAWRVQNPDCRLIGIADGGCGRSPNVDDGDLNYSRTGLFSRALTGVTELSLKYANYGAFVRASGLYDDAVENSNTQRTPLTRQAKDLVGSYTRLLDAFAYAKFDLAGKASEFRLGRQVVSWGESTFIQNGLNTINHVDVAALRVPGAELKEAFLPDEMAVFNIRFSDRWSAQALYLLSWAPTLPEPAGSYFSANDFATPGGSHVVLGFGGFSDQGVDFSPLGGALIPDFQQVGRLPDRNPKTSGQYGFNVKLYLPDFSNGTELGFYFLNYHSRLPVISGRSGSTAGVADAWGAVNAAGGAAQAVAAGLPLAAAIATGAAAGVAASRTNRLGYVGNLSLAQAAQYATIGANTLLAGGDVTAQVTNLATSEYAKTAGYFVEYPENIKMLGLSFNTQLQRTGIALQGELSYRHDVPLQYDDVELLFAALTPLEIGLGTLQLPPGAFALPPCTAGTPTLSKCGQLGQFAAGQDIRGWGFFDTYQFQFTATKTVANVLKAAQLVLVGEAGVTYVAGLPSKVTGGPNGRGLRLNGPGTDVSGSPEVAVLECPQLPAAQCAALNQPEPLNRFADSTSWGYRLAARLEYPNLIGPWNLLPRLAWQHDVSGTTPGPGGNFVEGRYGLTLGLGANLQARWDLDVAWTMFGGAGRFNELTDRDFVAASIKYSF